MSEPLPPDDDAPVPARPVHPPRPGGLRTIPAAAAEEVSGSRNRPRFLPPPTETPLPPSDVAPATVLMPAPLAHKSRLLSKAEAPDASPPEGPAPDAAAANARGVGFFSGVAPVAEVTTPASRHGALLGFVASVIVLGGLVVAAWPVTLELAREDERRLGTLWLKSLPPLRNDGVAEHVRRVGMSVAAPLTADLAGRVPRFYVLNDTGSARVLALPDASVVVTTGMLERLHSSAELATLLAHSLVHVARGDAMEALRAAGDADRVKDALDGSDVAGGLAVVTRALASPSSPADEATVDARTPEVLAAAGWSTKAPAGLVATLQPQHGRRRAAWLVAHPESPARLAAGTDGGRIDADLWMTQVLAPLSGRR